MGSTCHIKQTHPSDDDRVGFAVANYGSCDDADVSNFTGDFTKWPLFSLRPALHRTEFIVRLGSFDPTPTWRGLWPGIFELKFAIQWYCEGGTRAKLCDPVAFQNKGHFACGNQVLAQKIK